MYQVPLLGPDFFVSHLKRAGLSVALCLLFAELFQLSGRVDPRISVVLIVMGVLGFAG